ncbi:MAG: N4-gp56 family major capsid protein [Clostridiales bacterium]|jgi:N4-gp56 family major capsid protein|nr:N4-gp56 family major capsid protein [Clostridiales bacterium]
MANETLLSQLINPQVMADMISAELGKQLRATQFYKVDTTLTGRAGNTITVPTWLYIGAATDLAENEQGEVTEMQTKDMEYTVKKAVKNISLTDESVLSGYGDPVGEATRQLRMSIQDKMDDDGIAALQGITTINGHVATIAAAPAYEDVIDALDMLIKDNEEQGVAVFLLVNHNTAKTIRKSPQFIDRNSMLADTVLTSGVVGAVGGCSVVISNKLTDTEAYILTPQCMTAFIKRDINVEQERQMLYKRTVIGADAHYVVAIEDYDKVVALRWANP